MAKAYEELYDDIIQLMGNSTKSHDEYGLTITISEEFKESLNIRDPKSEVGAIKVMSHSNEGPLPHAHIVHKSFKTCVVLDEPKYFLHREFRDILNSEQRDVLIAIMNSRIGNTESNYGGDPNHTVWEACAHDWNKTVTQPGTRKIDIKAGMPDYTELPKPKHGRGRK